MDRDRLRRDIRQLVFTSRALSDAITSGNFRSAFKGRGMDFDSLREYETGDDALQIDWNASARLAKPFVKTWKEERSLQVLLIIDESPSMQFGEKRSKKETLVLSASLLAWACVQNGATISALFFGGSDLSMGSDLEFITPAYGERAAFTLCERLVAGRGRMGSDLKPGGSPQTGGQTSNRGSDLAKALDSASLKLKQKSLIIVLSDFLCSSWARSLAVLARKHDTALIRVFDKIDDSLPLWPFSLRAMDSETYKKRLIVPFSRQAQNEKAMVTEKRRFELLSAAMSARVPLLELDGQSNPAQALIDFFSRRRSG